MTGVRALLFAIALGLAGNAAAEGRIARTIDLGQPGALQALERDNPAHFAKVSAILREVPRLDPPTVEGWMRTRFDAQEISYRYRLLRTSYPAKTDLSFVLDDSRYVALVVVDAPASPHRAR